MKMEIAIVFYSMHGNCELVAGKVAYTIGADIIRIEPDKAYPDKGAKQFIWGGKSALMGEMPVLKPYEFDAEKYDTVIIGFPVWASNPAPPIKTFVNEHKDELKGKKIAAFACQSGNGAEKAFAKLKKQLEIDELVAELILIDPRTVTDDKNDGKIHEFCNKIFIEERRRKIMNLVNNEG